jgi:phosphoribosyl-AMP cyclohydrolase
MLKFDDSGLIPAIIQDVRNGEVLMLGYMNKESLKRTLGTRDVWFYSRSRQALWHKGETSGNFLRVTSVTKDCDSDALLIEAEPMGPVCHTGNRTCFFQELENEDTAGE